MDSSVTHAGQRISRSDTEAVASSRFIDEASASREDRTVSHQ